MLVGVIAEEDFITMQELCYSTQDQIDVLELRIDYLHDVPYEEISALQANLDKPFILTLRSKSEGGMFDGSFIRRMSILRKLIDLHPEYLDVEHDVPVHFVRELRDRSPKTKLICSYHEFTKTPDDLIKVLDDMYCHKLFAVYKIVTYAKSSIDAMRMLEFVQSNGQSCNLCGMCMGSKGSITRVMAPVVGGYFCYVPISKIVGLENALTIDELFNVYNYRSLNKSTRVFALLGDPVANSIGHIYHNNAFKLSCANAVYIKIPIERKELSDFFKIGRGLPFYGFSITMPLKEKVMRFIDKIDKNACCIRAVNTIVYKNGAYKGYNTDGKGALNVLEQGEIAIADANVVVLGAGGTAKAIIREAISCGADVLILNRTISKARKIAEQYGCRYAGFDQMFVVNCADIFINATSIGMSAEEKPLELLQSISSNCVVLDIVLGSNVFAECFDCDGREFFSGEKMFVEQAKLQQVLWGDVFSESDEYQVV